MPIERLHFLPNVVDCDQFRPGPPKENGPVRLLTVGRLGKEKRVDRFLSLLSHLRKRSPQLQFEGEIIGDGPLRPRLEQQARDLGLIPGVVRFRGAVADMATVYKDANVLVHTSDHEGTPNVLLEAMASGLPVVATRVGGVAEIIKHGETGYLVEVGNDDALLLALLKVVGDENLRRACATRAREHVVANYSVNRLPAYLDDLYRATLS